MRFFWKKTILLSPEQTEILKIVLEYVLHYPNYNEFILDMEEYQEYLDQEDKLKNIQITKDEYKYYCTLYPKK